MSSLSFPVKTVTEIKEIIGPLTKISGEPKLRDLLKLQDELISASQKIKDHARGPLGYLYLVIPLAAYQLYTTQLFILPLDPGDAPDIANCSAFGNDVEATKIEWGKQKQVYNMHKRVNEALRERMIEAIDACYVQDIHADTTVLASTSFLDYFQAYVDEYGKDDQEEVASVLAEMDTPWDPATSSAQALIRQIQDGMRYSKYVGEELSMTTVLRKAEALLLGTRKMANEYSEWMSRVDAERTWDNFKDWLRGKHRLWKIAHKPAAGFGYGGNITQVSASDEAPGEDEDYVNQMNMAMNAMNKASFDAMASQLQAMQQQNTFLQEQLAAAAKQHVPAQPTPPQQFQPNYQQQFQPPPQYYQPPQQQYQPPQQQYQPPQQQYQQQYQQQQSGGRGRGGGRRGYGRGGNRGRGGRGNGYYAQYQQQGGQQSGQGFYATSNQQNPVKRHDNMYYCWTHGFDVDHDSAHCTNRKYGHQEAATRYNCLGGCQAKKHKTILPSQAYGQQGMYNM